MVQKNYITQDRGEVLSFPYDWRQTFEHPFEMSRMVNEAFTIKRFISAVNERQLGLEILIFLFDYTFATRKQLKRLLQLKGILSDSESDGETADDKLDNLLQNYVDNRMINYFTLSSYELGEVPDDAFRIYCLDHAARYILSHFYHDDIAVTWKSTNALKSPELVSKYLMTSEFYLSLLTVKGSSLKAFQPTVDFRIRSREIRLSASMQILNGATPIDCILEVVRSSDLPVYWNKKTEEQIVPFITENFWKKYFRLEPIMIFVAENIEQAEELAEIYYRKNESNMFRVTLDSELLKGINEAIFYKYVPNNAIGERLIPVNAALFKTT